MEGGQYRGTAANKVLIRTNHDGFGRSLVSAR